MLAGDRASAPGEPVEDLLSRTIHVLAEAMEADWQEKTGVAARHAAYAGLRADGFTVAEAARRLHVDHETGRRHEAGLRGGAGD